MKTKVHNNAISSMRAEAMRLIELQKELLCEIKEKIPAASLEQGDGNSSRSTGLFTPKAIDLKVAALEDNRRKVDKLDMVLAVVGTMKAGKSTCINAIVGREILPNRNRPMTALPTIIRHIAGATTPVLHFTEQQQQPIQKLLGTLQQKLKNLDLNTVPKIASDQDLLVLAEAIRAKFTLQTSYEGEEGIFNFLKSLNDLVRISAELKIAFPFESYTSVSDFPSIEVEFFHLKQTDSSNQLGRFALLDTPGFNEAGQSQHLMPMLQEQLSKATAVLVVLDYTQLKSESEKQLRDELHAIAQYSGERMFALVNKFDQRNANSDDEAATRKYVANNLLQEVFDKRANVDTRIFPVSGQLAYLVKRAELTLDTREALGWEEGQPQNWMDTFGEEAFGTRYRKYINDRKEVLDACEELWTQSLFNAPLTHAIQYSHDNAAQMAVQAATDKLNEIALGSKNSDLADGVGSMLDMRLKGLQTTAEELDKLLQELSAGMKNLKRKEDNATNQLEALLADTKHRIQVHLDKASAETIQSVQSALQGSGSFNEPGEILIAAKGSLFSLLAKVLKPSVDDESDTPKIKTKRRTEKKSDTPPELKLDISDLMTFSSKSEAQSKLNGIANTITEFLENATVKIGDEVTGATEDFYNQLEKFHTEISTEVAEFKEHAEKAGFDEIKLKVPKIKRFKSVAASDSELDGIIQDKSYTVTRQREQSGGWGWIKRKTDLFSNGWGMDDYKDSVSKFEFSKEDLVARYSKFIENYSQQLKSTVQTHFSVPLEAGKEDFFAHMNTAFDSIRESMESSRQDQLRGKEQQAQIVASIESLKQLYDDSLEEIKELVRNAKKLSLTQQGT